MQIFVAALFLKRQQLLFNRWRVKTVVHPYHRILLSNKKEETIDTHNNMYGSQGHYAE